MSENINEYKLKLEEFCNTRDKLFTLLQNEENIEKRIHLQELIIKAEENIKYYQLLHVNSFSNDNNKNNNNKINNIEDGQEINSDKELNIETNKNIKEKLNNNNNLKNKYKSKKDSSNNKKKTNNKARYENIINKNKTKELDYYDPELYINPLPLTYTRGSCT